MARDMLGALTDLLFRRGGRAADDEGEERTLDKSRNGPPEPSERVKSGMHVRSREDGDLDAISGMLAHDLRNPLNTVGLNVHLVRTALAQNDLELGTLAADHIERAKQQMVETVDRFRALARASFGEVVREPVDMAGLARVLCERLGPAEPLPEVEMVVADLPPTEADPKLARVLLWGLLASALEATRGRPQRRVEVGYEPGAKPLTYYVSDDGTDLDPAGSYDQAVWRRTDGGSQVDPWLDVAVRAITRHGGEVRASHRPGGGVTVRFRLTGRGVPHDAPHPATPRAADSRGGSEN